LFKSNPVHQAFTKSLTDIRTLLGIEENGSSSKKRMRAKDYANASASEEKGRSPANPNANGAPKSASSTEDEWDGLSSSQDYQRPPESEGSDSDHEDFSIYDSRLAASSDDDSELNDSESDHLQEAENLDPESITETDTPDSDPPRTLNPPKKQRPPRPTPKPTKSTTFLPSLSTSGYISASDSTASSLSDSAPAGRKNRMGQQARRALWEKKFGSGARHLKMGGGDRDEGWDARRGARGGDARGKRGRGRGGGDRGRGSGRERKGGSGRGPVSSGANSETVGVKKAKLTAGAGALHPSWEAAKRAKEQKNTAPFQGKKVVFV